MRKELLDINAKIKPVKQKLKGLEEDRYHIFRSETWHKRNKSELPHPCVTLELPHIFRGGYRQTYTGYAEALSGQRLLAEYEATKKQLSELEGQRDRILAPYREKLGQKKFESDKRIYELKVRDYKTEKTVWEKQYKDHWSNPPIETVPVSSLSDEQAAGDWQSLPFIQQWGRTQGRRNEDWKLEIEGKTKNGKHQVICRRPLPFRVNKPYEPMPPRTNLVL